MSDGLAVSAQHKSAQCLARSAALTRSSGRVWGVKSFGHAILHAKHKGAHNEARCARHVRANCAHAALTSLGPGPALPCPGTGQGGSRA